MIKYENDCCGCAVPAYPCMGNSCPLRHVKHVYCDCCNEDVDEEYYEINGEDLCEECLNEHYLRRL